MSKPAVGVLAKKIHTKRSNNLLHGALIRAKNDSKTCDNQNGKLDRPLFQKRLPKRISSKKRISLTLKRTLSNLKSRNTKRTSQKLTSPKSPVVARSAVSKKIAIEHLNPTNSIQKMKLTLHPKKQSAPEAVLLGKGSYGTVIRIMKDNGFYARKRLLKTAEGVDYSTLRECTVLSMFNHPYMMNPHAIEISGHGTVDIFLTLAEYDLFKFIQTHPYNERRELMPRVLYCVGSVLHYLHSNNIIHRDVKPSNILLDKEHTVYLTDMGAAKDLNIMGDRKGFDLFMTPDLITYPYRPPEVKTNSYDYRADIYSLGTTLIHLATGCFPSRTNTQHQHEIPPSPSEWHSLLHSKCPDLSMEWRSLLLHMTSSCPDHRPSTYEILSHDVLEYQKTFPKGTAVQYIPPPGVRLFKDPYTLDKRSKMVDELLIYHKIFRISNVITTLTMQLFDDALANYDWDRELPNLGCILAACFSISNKYVNATNIFPKDLIYCSRWKFTEDDMFRMESYVFLLLNFRIARRPLFETTYSDNTMFHARTFVGEPYTFQNSLTGKDRDLETFLKSPSFYAGK